jgi:hypothetical protein
LDSVSTYSSLTWKNLHFSIRKLTANSFVFVGFSVGWSDFFAAVTDSLRRASGWCRFSLSNPIFSDLSTTMGDEPLALLIVRLAGLMYVCASITLMIVNCKGKKAEKKVGDILENIYVLVFQPPVKSGMAKASGTKTESSASKPPVLVTAEENAANAAADGQYEDVTVG